MDTVNNITDSSVYQSVNGNGIRAPIKNLFVGDTEASAMFIPGRDSAMIYNRYYAVSYDTNGTYDLKIPESIHFMIIATVGGGNGGQRGSGGNNSAGKGGSAGHLTVQAVDTLKENLPIVDGFYNVVITVGRGGRGGDTDSPGSGGHSAAAFIDGTRVSKFQVRANGGTTLASSRNAGVYTLALDYNTIAAPLFYVKPTSSNLPVLKNTANLPSYRPTIPGTGNGGKDPKGLYGAGGNGGDGGIFGRYTWGGDGADGLVQIFMWGVDPTLA